VPLFGTDGVRGVANADLTPERALAIGRAITAVLGGGVADGRPIVIGRDTRLSGTMLEAAVTAGITSAGRDVLSAGILPTPGVAAVTRELGAVAGVMISASHNPIEDNGIKVFGPDGFKLADGTEAAIERAVTGEGAPRPTHAGVGIARSDPALAERYLVRLVAAGADLSGLTVVVDAAYGAAYHVGPEALRRLGAEVVALHAEADGARINVACGTTNMARLAEHVAELGRERAGGVVGVAFDGDADRALFVAEDGSVLSGDHILLILARERLMRAALPGATVVATVMSNVGLEHAMTELGLALMRTPVGDRYVLEEMRAGGHPLGGEQSGHIVDIDRNTTGDGPMTAIAVLSTMMLAGTSLRELSAGLRVYPQILLNVRMPAGTVAARVLESDAVRTAIAAAEQLLAQNGRILVRPSGTEPLLRVMVEGSERAEIERLGGGIADAIADAVRDSSQPPA
jgi:phosphoglucosamine mutase